VHPKSKTSYHKRRTPFIRIVLDGEPSGYAENPDNLDFSLKTCYIGNMKFGCYQLQYVKMKVKVTLVQKLRLCIGRTVHRGSRGIGLLFHDQRH
jgi:hypothetical protein